MAFERAVPVLRIFDIAKARELHADSLGMSGDRGGADPFGNRRAFPERIAPECA